MSEEERSKKSADTVSEDQRYRFIGFEVYPGKPKDLFKSESEKQKYVEGVVAKRSRGEVIREECLLLVNRIGFVDRLVLTIASLVVVASLFLPWYSAYNEIVTERQQPAPTNLPADTVMQRGAEEAPGQTPGEVTGGEQPPAADEPEEAEGAVSESETGAAAVQEPAGSENIGGEQIIVSALGTRRQISYEYVRLSGIGALAAIGSVGSYVFSSGFVLILTALIFIIYTLLCLVLPVYTLLTLYGGKGDPDQRALKLKKTLRLNWIPLVLILFCVIISFAGAEYEFQPGQAFDSLGASYGVGVFLDTLTAGVFVSLIAFILIAVKGIEI